LRDEDHAAKVRTLGRTAIGTKKSFADPVCPLGRDYRQVGVEHVLAGVAAAVFASAQRAICARCAVSVAWGVATMSARWGIAKPQAGGENDLVALAVSQWEAHWSSLII